MSGAKPIEQYRSDLTQKVLGYAFEIHTALGSRLLESAYEQCLVYELKQNGFHVEQQFPIAIRYKDLQVPNAFKADLIVEDNLIIELKAVERLMPIHEAQIIHYMHLSRKPLGLLLNFKESSLKNGIKRYFFDKYVQDDPFSSSSTVIKI